MAAAESADPRLSGYRSEAAHFLAGFARDGCSDVHITIALEECSAKARRDGAMGPRQDLEIEHALWFFESLKSAADVLSSGGTGGAFRCLGEALAGMPPEVAAIRGQWHEPPGGGLLLLIRFLYANPPRRGRNATDRP